MSHTEHFRGRLVGKTIQDVVHNDPSHANKMFESITLTFTDGSSIKVLSYGYALDTEYKEPQDHRTMTRAPMKRRAQDMSAGGWVEVVTTLASDPKTVERAQTVLLLLGVTVAGSGGSFYCAADNPSKYGNWETLENAMVAYCVAEGIDIES